MIGNKRRARSIGGNGEAEAGKATAPNGRLCPTTFSASRLLDFCSKDELVKQTGHSPTEWPLVILKELVDNALDACEEAGVAPIIEVVVDGDGITVSDNGPGIPASTVESLLDYHVRTSSRIGYIAPTRGAQGNALQTVLAMPYVLSGKRGRIDISSHQRRHEIAFRVDVIRQEPAIERKLRATASVKSGAIVKVWWPTVCMQNLKGCRARFLQIASHYALLNPHAELTVRWFDRAWNLRPTSTTWQKWGPAEPTSPYWYTGEDFERLLAAYIAHDADRGQDRLVRNVVAEFRGMSATARQKAVLKRTGLARTPLSALKNCDGLQRGVTDGLLGVLKAETKPVKPAMLGLIGKEHIGQWFAGLGADLDTLEYRRVMSTEDESLPWVVEVAFAAMVDEEADRRIIAGVNWSPAIVNPFQSLGRWGGLDGLLEEQRAGEGQPVVLLIHLARPRPQFRDRGKASVVVDSRLGGVIEEAVIKVTARWAKVRKQEEREQRRAWRRRELLSKPRRTTTLADAIIGLIPKAAEQASGGGRIEFPKRNLFYSVRALIQSVITKPLEWNYFCHVLTTYERGFGPVPKMYCDPKGYLIEPHTGNIVPLGTREVDAYQFPVHLYDKVLYVEKKGMMPIFRDAQLAEMYDVAIVCAEGYANRAAKTLLSAAQDQHAMMLLSLHDADPHGYNIARTLREATASCPDHRINLIDIGLRLEEALDLGLDTEEFIRKKSLPSALSLNEVEREYFIGEERRVDGRRAWKARRIELNALAKDPDQFVGWVEQKLAEHDLATKLVPPAKIIAATSEERRADLLRARARAHVSDVLDIDGMVDRICAAALGKIKVRDIPKQIREWAGDLPAEPWRDCVDAILRQRLEQIDREVRKAAIDIAGSTETSSK